MIGTLEYSTGSDVPSRRQKISSWPRKGMPAASALISGQSADRIRAAVGVRVVKSAVCQAPDQVVTAISEHLGGCRIDEVEHAVGVGAVDAFTGGGQDQFALMIEADLGGAARVLEAEIVGDTPIDLGLEPGVVVAQDVARALQFELVAHAREHDGRLDRLHDVVCRAEQTDRALRRPDRRARSGRRPGSSRVAGWRRSSRRTA
jgi:hypothetical protein